MTLPTIQRQTSQSIITTQENRNVNDRRRHREDKYCTVVVEKDVVVVVVEKGVAEYSEGMVVD